MSGELANEGADLGLNLLFRNTGSSPAAVYLGLATVEVAEDDTLTTLTEEDDAGYARQAVTFGAPADVGGVEKVANTGALVFGAWVLDGEEIAYAFLTDAASGTVGSVLARFTLTTAKTPAAGETLTVPIGDLVFGLD